MLSSIILSLVVNTSPAPVADQDSLIIEEVGRKARTIRLSDDFQIEKTGRKARTIRLSDDFQIEKTGRKARTIRL